MFSTLCGVAACLLHVPHYFAVERMREHGGTTEPCNVYKACLRRLVLVHPQPTHSSHAGSQPWGRGRRAGNLGQRLAVHSCLLGGAMAGSALHPCRQAASGRVRRAGDLGQRLPARSLLLGQCYGRRLVPMLAGLRLLATQVPRWHPRIITAGYSPCQICCTMRLVTSANISCSSCIMGPWSG